MFLLGLGLGLSIVILYACCAVNARTKTDDIVEMQNLFRLSVHLLAKNCMNTEKQAYYDGLSDGFLMAIQVLRGEGGYVYEQMSDKACAEAGIDAVTTSTDAGDSEGERESTRDGSNV